MRGSPVSICAFQSAKRISAVSNMKPIPDSKTTIEFQSAKRISAVSNLGGGSVCATAGQFQSAKRISAVSNVSTLRIRKHVTVSFNPPSGLVLFRTRRTHAQEGKKRFQSAKRISAVSNSRTSKTYAGGI